ncbi:MAG: N-acetylmuramoyl-L-alanine amidase [Ignavibacteriaceae bacterium]|nr:N-acetylmuramoyl-L-alanine amidase [Ignavibacteriaceae bacterium]
MKLYLQVILYSALIFFLSSCATKEVVKEEEEKVPQTKEVEEIPGEEIIEIKPELKTETLPIAFPSNASIEHVTVDKRKKIVNINLSKEFSYVPFRYETVETLYKQFREELGLDYSDYEMKIRALDTPIEELIPNYYRNSFADYDYRRMPISNPNRPLPIVRNVDSKNNPTKGLNDKNIILWHSHGWYYNHKLDRWEWQRPRLFQSVEDLIPMSFTIPYLIPMLENAGAKIFVPRERDIQTNEVVVDNDSPTNPITKSRFFIRDGERLVWQKTDEAGFGIGSPPYKENENPFEFGKSIFTYSNLVGDAQCDWIPEIPETGEYAVYVSYRHSAENVNNASYTVFHAGGKTELKVNQQIGGGTWIYIGKYLFNKGYNPQNGKVVLSNKSDEMGMVVSADAVRFGGGMGIIERNGTTSGRPKFAEGARYWLQYAGMPDTLIFSFNGNENDYNDDYQSRAEYGNYLYGKPYGPNKNRSDKGLSIPIDLSLAFHTDAGISRNDTVIGTLAIYSLTSTDSQFVFPDGVSRFANRDLADIIQTQIIDDLRNKYDVSWTRRHLMEARYSESVRPNIPSLLLELLSHQNFLDMKFVLDPRFRFDVSRAIYKGMLRFLSSQYNFDYVVQPLPVTHFSTEFDKNGYVILNWQPQADALEPTANPTKYIVYTKINGGGFDNGVLVEGNSFVKQIDKGNIYSFKVTAVNEGGESFPSEILSVCKTDNSKNPILIINGFDRIAPPATIEDTSFVGFANFIDAGVPDKFDINFTGLQFDFNPNSAYISNDAPGHGASHADFETKIVAGNTFDFPYIHGQAIKSAGYSFVSCSDDAVMEGFVDLKKYKMVDLILGEEKKTKWQKPFADSVNGIQFEAFPKKLQECLSDYLNKGKGLFISGAYVGSDLFSSGDESINFAKNILHFNLVTGHAAKSGDVSPARTSFLKNMFSFQYSNQMNDSIYAVEAPDAIMPSNGGEVILRYKENQFSAAVGYKNSYGVIVFGFPFESIIKPEVRYEIMRQIIKYFGM